MVGPRDAVSPGWDALAPATGRDALAIPATDAFSATYGESSADALSVEYRADALAAGTGDAGTGEAATGDAATGDALAAAPIGDSFGDSLTAYGDATAAQSGARPTPVRRRGPGPVPPRPTAGDGSTAGTAQAGRAGTGRRGTGRESRGDGPTPRPRRAAGSAGGRTTPRTGSGGSTAGRTVRPGPAAGSSAYTGGSSTPTRPAPGSAYSGGSSTLARRGSGPQAGGTGRSGAGGSAPSGAGKGAAGSGESSGGPPDDVPGARGQVPTWSSPWWANRTGRPTGTVPWESRTGRSGWDDFFAGTGGSAGRSGKQPSGAEVARALLQAFRRGMRDR
ncbi:MAG TPA: hypothetical protein VH573_12465 [Mycobacteriales bacterium]|jgi:hypothetical protein